MHCVLTLRRRTSSATAVLLAQQHCCVSNYAITYSTTHAAQAYLLCQQVLDAQQHLLHDISFIKRHYSSLCTYAAQAYLLGQHVHVAPGPLLRELAGWCC